MALSSFLFYLASNCTLGGIFMKKKVQTLTLNAVIASGYAVLTLVISPFAYGAIQMRITEIIVLLSCYNKKFIPGLVIGCFLANLNSPLGMYDLLFGTFATLIACILMHYVKNVYFGALVGSLVNGLIIGLELYLALELPFFINVIYVFIGEFIVLLVGAFLFKQLEKNEYLMKQYIK